MKWIIFLLFIAILCGSYIRYIEATSVFAPVKAPHAKPEDFGLTYKSVFLNTKDRKRLHGWMIESPSSENYLIYFHGNAGNISDRLEKMALLTTLNINIFIVDYRGYGLSTGRPTEQGLYIDALTAFDHVRRGMNIEPQHIIVYGASLGAVAALDVAQKRDFAGLIIDSAFTSAVDMGRFTHPHIPPDFIKVKLDALDRIKNVKIPKLFFHSVDDTTVPIEMGRRLFDAAPPPKDFVEIQGPHSLGYKYSKDIFMEKMSGFLNRLGI